MSVLGEVRERLRGGVGHLFGPARQTHVGYDAATLTWLAAGQDDTCRAVLALSRTKVVGQAEYEVLRTACEKPNAAQDAGRLEQLWLELDAACGRGVVGTVLRRSGAALLWWALNPEGQEPAAGRPQPRVVKGQAVAPRGTKPPADLAPADDGWGDL